ncbi:MAG: hypothetical protein AAF938_12620 [Myxococcota bacterium]
MSARFLITLLACAALSACTTKDEPNCNPGFEPSDDACVPVDAAVEMEVDMDIADDADIGMDGDTEPDLGPCGEVCGGATPVCNEGLGRCAECAVAADCAARAPRTECSDEGTCVQCTGNSDCTDPEAPVCGADGLCEACTVGSADDCTGVTGSGGETLAVCTDVGGTPTCVECTADDESACGDEVCDVRNRTCSDEPAGETNLCQPCVSNSQCIDGQVCAQDPRADEPPLFVCLWRQDASGDAAPNGVCGNANPYNTTRSEQALIDGTTATVCTRRFASCLAAADHLTFGRGDTECTGDSDCGREGAADGLCRDDGGIDRCTIACTVGSNDDCLVGGFEYECLNSGVAPPTCGFVPQ